MKAVNPGLFTFPFRCSFIGASVRFSQRRSLFQFFPHGTTLLTFIHVFTHWKSNFHIQRRDIPPTFKKIWRETAGFFIKLLSDNSKKIICFFQFFARRYQTEASPDNSYS